MFQDDKTKKLYEERLKRYVTAMRRGTPDRVPVRFFLQEAAARYVGMSNPEVALSYEKAFLATRRAAQDLQLDAVMLNAIWSNYGVGKAASWRYLNVPGVDVGPQSVLQFSEPGRDEDLFLRPEEYGAFCDDPTAFLLTTWMPRATTRLARPGEPATLEHNAALIAGAMAFANYMTAFGPASAALKYEAGVVSANSGMIKAPLDLLADKFRGYMGMAMDTIERPADVRRACEALVPHIVANALSSADPDKNVPITLWAHRGCVPFISQQTFDAIFWPTLLPVLQEIIARGHQVLFYGEGNWERHYDALRTLPEGGIIYHLDKGDPAVAARAFKGRFALSGGLSYDVLARGTPADTARHVRDLLAVMKPDGGYILDCSALMLSDVQPQNLRAAVDAAMEHGVYSSSSAAPQKPMASVAAPAIAPGKRPPFVCVPWAQESASYRALSPDRAEAAPVRAAWESVDGAAYSYVWTTVLW